MLISNGQVTPVSYADSTPQLANRNYYPRGTLSLANTFSSYAAVYRSQLWVSTLVNKLAYATARLPLKVYERSSDDARTPARDSDFAKLLRNPNTKHDPFFFWLWTASTFEVYGEAMWIKVRPAPGRPPTQLWPMHPANIYTRFSDEGRLIYVYHAGTASAPILEWDESDVVHFRSYNPDNQIRGMSRLEPLRQTILTEDASRRATQAFWSNGARPSVLLTAPGELSDNALLRLKASWDSAHGGIDSWGKTAVLENGLTANVVQLNSEEMQYIEGRKIAREEACGIYDVPPPAVHILDHATFSNITEQFRSMYRDTMAPRLGLYESVMDSQLRVDFDPQGKFYAEFLMDEVLRGAFEERSVSNQAAINSGQRTPNEVRRQDNLPPLPGGDQLYINAASIPLAAAAAGPATGTDIVAHPQAIKSCVVCDVHGSTSGRGLCRSCEGRRSRALDVHLPKEITP